MRGENERWNFKREARASGLHSQRGRWKRENIVPAILCVLIICLIPLIFGMESVLLIELPGALSFGTLLAAIVIISASIIPVVQSKPGSIYRRIAIVLNLASILWLPLGIYLSGNASLSFVQDAADSQFFWRYTGGLSLSILIILIWTGIKFTRDRHAV